MFVKANVRVKYHRAKRKCRRQELPDLRGDSSLPEFNEITASRFDFSFFFFFFFKDEQGILNEIKGIFLPRHFSFVQQFIRFSI
jgi:hypothetical protein